MRRPVVLALFAIAVVALHAVLVRAMAHGHVAHVLLGAGNRPPPLDAALLAVALVVVRLFAIVIVPGLLLAAAAQIVAYVLVGPCRQSSRLGGPTPSQRSK